ncbi:MAG: VOC family protein [Hyphomicrobiaceae bacterium]|nr:VOC family protein [Hyphomicrobiaceae bacterium]MCC0023422.1 VOC family protein [Hyphomicrobiaceae bacterium]
MAAPIVKQVAHVCIFAHDIDETAAWYQKTLGFEKRFNFTRDGKVFGYYLDAGGRTFLEVFHKDASSFSEDNQINHICYEVSNMDDAIAHIRAQGVEARDKSIGCDDTWQSWITDPNGVKIELFEYTDQSAQFVGRDRVAHW